MAAIIEPTGLAYYADVNPPPAGVVIPPGYRAASSLEVGDESVSGVKTIVASDGNNMWVVPASTPATPTLPTVTTTNTNTTKVTNTDGAPVQEIVVTAKRPKRSVVVPNPLHKYASYTYSWSLWWLDPMDYSTLSGLDSVVAAADWSPTVGKSFVVAEDGGRFVDQRLPTSRGYNYHINGVNFNTTIAPNRQSLNTNMLTGSMVIREPYGVTLLEVLAMQAFLSKPLNQSAANYTDHPYMLQLDFVGYDDDGKAIPEGDTAIFRKRFPIKISNIKLEVTTAGTEYRLTFFPSNHVALHEQHANIPKAMPVSGSTVGEVFRDLSKQLQQHWAEQVTFGLQGYSDGISFEFDPSISQSKIVYPKDESIAGANSDGVTLDLKTKQFMIPEGTKIVDVINKIMSLSEFIINQLKTQGGLASAHTSSFNSFKVVVGLQYGAAGKADPNTIEFAVHDPVRNQYPKIIKFKIHQYTTFAGNHPALDQAPDSKPFTVKAYNYLYTGKNIDIINFKLNFDTTYYSQVLSYKANFAASQAAEDVEVNAAEARAGLTLNVGPSLLSVRYPALSNIPILTPVRYLPVVNNQAITAGFGILGNPQAQKAADVITSLYSTQNGDMLAVDLTIIGDPHLIKQDDWYFSPGPSSKDYAGISQSDFATKYGWLRMDTGDLIVSLTVNTPIDQDADVTGKGLMLWQGGSSSPTQSMFSGQYRVLTIQNNFANGKFEQVLKLARYINGDVASGLATLTNDAVSNSRTNQQAGGG